MVEITKEDIINIIKNLHGERPFFWSEADFQHTFAWKLKEKYEKAKIFLERRYEPNEEDNIVYYIDIWVELNGKCYPIELKYKTAELEISTSTEITKSRTVKLKAQGAQDTGRYDFLKDIQRIEDIKTKETNTFGKGFAIILTNDFHYYKNPNKDNSNKEVSTLDRKFRIHEGVNFKADELYWVDKKGERFNYNNDDSNKHWTHKYPPLKLIGSYQMSWMRYDNKDDTKDFESFGSDVFCFAICEI